MRDEAEVFDELSLETEQRPPTLALVNRANMTSDEQAIIDFLRVNGQAFVSRKEIARKAVHRSVFEESPRWADAPLVALVNRNVVERNDAGQYRLARTDSAIW